MNKKNKEIIFTIEEVKLIWDLLAYKYWDFHTVFQDKKGRWKCIQTDDGKKFQGIWSKIQSITERL